MIAILVGIGLAASCGFRVFVPLLVVSAAVHAGYLEVSTGFDWLATRAALIAFAIASAVEIAAYYVPWLDNALDSIASPSAFVAGTVLFAASAVDFDPFLQWSLAIIAGGGSAALVQSGTVVTRLASTATTAGLANALFTTVETLAGIFFSVASIAVPIVAIALLLVVVASMFIVARRMVRRLRPQ